MYDFLHSHRYIPNPDNPEGKSPAELFLGRKIRSPLTALLPTDSPADARSKEKEEKMEHQFNHHHGARERNLEIGDNVIINLRGDKRELGTVSRQISKNVVEVQLSNNQKVQRHLNHVWKGGTRPLPTGTNDYLLSPGKSPIRTRPETSQNEEEAERGRDEEDNLRDAEAAVQEPTTTIQTQETPRRSRRERAPPRRLNLDPNAKTYSDL